MNPFDGSPSSPPISFEQPPGPPTEPVEPPAPSPAPEPRRGRMVVAVFATAGLLGAAAFGVSELASADDEPELTTPDDADDDADSLDDADDGSSSSDEPADDDSDDSAPGSDDQPLFNADGELRLDTGDGEPIIIDLDDIDPESLAEFTECMGLPSFGFGEGMPDLDPEQFDQFFDEFDPEQFDQFFEGLDPEQLQEQFDEFFGDFEFDFEGDQLDPEQFEGELGPLFESEQFGDLFEQFFDGFGPELFEQFFEDFDPEQFDQFFDEMPPFGEEFGEHEAARRPFERGARPDFSGGVGSPFGLDQEKIDDCLAELE